MSAAFRNPTTLSTVAAPRQFATPVNSVQTIAAPTMISPGTTTRAAPSYTTMAAPMTTMAVPQSPRGTISYGPSTSAVRPSTYAQAAPVTQVASYVAPPVQYTQAPVQYAQAAPQVTYAQAAPVTQRASYVAPPVQYTQAAPQVTYTQAAPVTQVASYVAPPTQVLAAPTMITQAAPTMIKQEAPVPLTQGLPTPDQISSQKNAYAAALDKQLKDGLETIQKETEIEKSMVKFTADKQLALMQMQIEEQRNEKLASLDETATIRQCELRKAFVERTIQLDNQANGLGMDYQLKAAQTEFAQKKKQFEQTYVSKENALAAQYNQEVARANTGTTYAVPGR